MSESANSLPPLAEDAVKAHIRANRSRLAADGELLALLLPERFAGADICDLQFYTIEKLRAENTALKAKLEAVERAVRAWGNPPKI